MSNLKYLFFRIYIYFTGIKFFKTDIHPVTKPLRSAIFTTIKGDIITFNFYKEVSEDIFFIKGNIIKEKFYYYVVIADFPTQSFEELKEFNNLRYCFREDSIWIKDEVKISQMLIGVYMDFITSEIELKKKLYKENLKDK